MYHRLTENAGPRPEGASVRHFLSACGTFTVYQENGGQTEPLHLLNCPVAVMVVGGTHEMRQQLPSAIVSCWRLWRVIQA